MLKTKKFGTGVELHRRNALHSFEKWKRYTNEEKTVELKRLKETYPVNHIERGKISLIIEKVGL